MIKCLPEDPEERRTHLLLIANYRLCDAVKKIAIALTGQCTYSADEARFLVKEAQELLELEGEITSA